MTCQEVCKCRDLNKEVARNLDLDMDMVNKAMEIIVIIVVVKLQRETMDGCRERAIVYVGRISDVET